MLDCKPEVRYGIVLLKALEELMTVGVIDFPLAAMIYAYFCKLSDDEKKKMKEERDLCE